MTNDIRHFVGMDIGDAESVVAICSSDGHAEPTVIESARMPTLIAQRDRKAKPEIGYDAPRVKDPVELDVSFKCDPVAEYAQWRLSAGLVLVFIEELHQRVFAAHPELWDPHQVLIGCPVGWNAEAVRRYEELFTDSPYLSTAVVVRESRGALLQAWENVIDVPVLLDEPDGWLSHYRTILTQLAHDPALATTTILLTGGGAHIPQIVETTRRTLSGHTIQITTDPMTSVAKGLAVHGWLDHAVSQFEVEAKN